METIKDGTIVEFLNDKDQKLVGEIKLYNPIGDFYLVQAEIDGHIWYIPSERIIKQWS
jgi:hypothetical protein